MKLAPQLGRRARWYATGARRPHSSASRVDAKRLAARQRRRAEARDPEDAPTRFTRGWYD